MLEDDLDYVVQEWDAEEIIKFIPVDLSSGDSFGNAVSISGDTAIIGSRYDDEKGVDSGSVYIFKSTNGDKWTQVAKLTAIDGHAEDNFGMSVGLNSSGDVAIVGAIWDDDNGTDSGSAYIFKTLDGVNWKQIAKLAAANGQENDNFGLSVDISGDGDTAIVGSFLDDDKGTDSGSAYIFNSLDDGSWNQVAQLTASDGSSGDCFGRSVSISGNSGTAIVGAYSKDYDSYRTNSGKAYIYKTADGLTWDEEAILNASDLSSDDSFGTSVAMNQHGDTAIIGAVGADVRYTYDGISYLGRDAGVAYVFAKSNGDTWIQQDTLIANDPTGGNSFGSSVSINAVGNTVVVGCPFDNVIHAGSPDYIYRNQGSAYIFNKSDGFRWNQKAKIIASDGAENEWFGHAVDIDGNSVIVGVSRDDDNGSASGSAYIFDIHE